MTDNLDLTETLQQPPQTQTNKINLLQSDELEDLEDHLKGNLTDFEDLAELNNQIKKLDSSQSESLRSISEKSQLQADKLIEQTRIEMEQMNDELVGVKTKNPILLATAKIQQLKRKLSADLDTQNKRMESFESLINVLQSGVKNNSSQMEQFQQVFNEKISANMLKLESRLLESIKVANSQTIEVNSRLLNLQQRFEDNLKTTSLLEEKSDAQAKILKKVDEGITDLQELRDLKTRGEAIIPALTKIITKYVNETLLPEFRKLEPRIDFMQKMVKDDKFKLEHTLQTHMNQIESALREIKQLDEKTQMELNNYLLIVDYEDNLQKIVDEQHHEMENYCKVDVVQKLLSQCEKFALIETTDRLKKQIGEVKVVIKEKLVQKDELVQVDQSVRKWSTNTFLTMSLAESRFEEQVVFLKNMHRSVGDMQKQILETTMGLQAFRKDVENQTADNTSKLQKLVTEVQSTLTRCALYDDFKDLYNKVLPPLKILQDQFQELSNQYVQTTEVIQNFDLKMGNFALKHEIVEYCQDLRNLCRQSEFNQFKEFTEKNLREQGLFAQNLYKTVSEREDRSYDEMKQLVRKSIFTFYSQLNKNQPKTLDETTIDQLKYISDNITQLLQSKADVEEIKSLKEEKTNKMDTEHCLRCIDVLYKQVQSVCILVSEVFRQGFDIKAESQPAIIKKQEYLHEQTQNLFDWMKKFDPNSKDQPFNIPGPNLMNLHTFTDKVFSEQVPDPLNVTSSNPFKTMRRSSNDRYGGKALWASQIRSKNLSVIKDGDSRYSSMELQLPLLQNDHINLQSSTSRNFADKIKSRNFADQARQLSNSLIEPDMKYQTIGSSLKLVNKLQQDSISALGYTSAITQTPIKYDLKLGAKRQPILISPVKQSHQDAKQFQKAQKSKFDPSPRRDNESQGTLLPAYPSQQKLTL